jgi:hypothetical protein
VRLESYWMAKFDGTSTRPIDLSPECCPKARDYIRIHAADPVYGPDDPGWAISIWLGHDDVVRENITHCPFCGTKLGDW